MKMAAVPFYRSRPQEDAGTSSLQQLLKGLGGRGTPRTTVARSDGSGSASNSQERFWWTDGALCVRTSYSSSSEKCSHLSDWIKGGAADADLLSAAAFWCPQRRLFIRDRLKTRNKRAGVLTQRSEVRNSHTVQPTAHMLRF